MLDIKPPTFHDYRTTNDAVMIPSPFFIKQLRTLDPLLYVQWDRISMRWEIWKKPKGKPPYMVMRVQNQDRSYRDLGADILLKLQEGDPWRFTEREFLAYFDAMDDAIQESKRRALLNKVESVRKEHLWWIRGLRVQVPKRFEKDAIKLKGPSPFQKMVRVLGQKEIITYASR